MTKKYFVTFLLMLPALFFGNLVDTNDDNSNTEPLTVETTEANAAFFTIALPDDPNCSGSDTFLWENNVHILNTGWAAADVRFIDSSNGYLSYAIPGPYPSEFASAVVININEAISWDGYATRPGTAAQTAEQWKVVFLKNGVVQFESDYTPDLQDGTESAQWKGALNQNIQLPNGVDQILLVHYEDDTYGSGSVTSANSVVPSSVCFSYEPICDIVANAGDDIEVCTDDNVELTATFTGTNECVSGCVYPVLETGRCGSSNTATIWLRDPNKPSSEYTFDASSQSFETFDNGTARYTATASNGSDQVQLNFLYSGYTTTAPANSPKTHNCGAHQEVNDFVYYTNLQGTVTSQTNGTFTATSTGPAFQVGVGGDVIRSGFGASGWFLLSGGNGKYTNGDINMNLGQCVEQTSNDVSYMWTTTDGTIVGDPNQQTIEVSDSGSYMVKVTNCNGCEDTDTVQVDILEKLIIGDFVFDDLNRNGLQDSNEPGIDGVTVTLYNADGSVAAETVTANGGAYSFEVCPGEYYVVFSDIPTGFDITEQDAGNDDLDSDADANGQTPNFVLTDTDNPTIDCGIVAQCNIDPTVDGTVEVCSGEEAMITATGGDTYLWSTGETTASIKVNPTVTTTYTVVVSDSTIADCEEELSFTVEVTEKLIIGDFVFDDLNRNGLQDSNEPGIDGVTVTLYNADGTVADETVTANGGAYSFEVCPGEYYVVFSNLPADTAFTGQDAGDDALDSDADANGQTPNVVITDSNNPTIDAGVVATCAIDPTVDGTVEVCSGEEAMITATGGDTYLWSTGETTASIKVNPTATTTYTVVVSDSTIPDCSEELSFTVNVTEKLVIGDLVWNDLNRNGLYDSGDAGEPGIDGVTVTLYNADGSVTDETVTANGGAYSFEVCPGEYYVVFSNLPADTAFTGQNAGDDALDSDADANGQTPNFVITDSNNPTIDAGLVATCTLDPAVDGTVEVCSGEEAMITATGGDTYLWSTGETTALIKVNPTATTTYTVVVSDSTIPDCSEELSFTVNVTEKLVIGDFVFDDANRNGLQDPNEPGIDGVTVTLYNADGTVADETVTANGGAYSFEVCPGEYYVVFSNLPADTAFTGQDAGDDALDSDADANGQTPNFVVTDSNNTTIDAGLVATCTIDPAVDGEAKICVGEEAMITASGGNTYLWSTGETTASIKVNPTATTTYTVVVSDSTIPGCEEELSFTVTVESVDIDAGADVTIKFGEDATLTVSGADASDSILWSTGETTASIVVSPETAATYSVTVVNAFGCMDEDSVTVNVSNPCGIEPSFKILPRDQPGNYTPGYETAACIGDNFYLWMFDPAIDVLNEFNGQDYAQWSFTFVAPNGDVVVQDNRPNYPGNHRFEVLDLTVEDFGDYTISWVAPSGCAGSTVFTLNFPDAGCGDNGVRTSDFYSMDAVYPSPARSGSEITIEISTKNQSISNLTAKDASNGKVPEFVSRKETIKLSLYNMNGRLVSPAKAYEVEQGKVKVYYQLGSLPTGNYIIKVDGANWTDSKQILVK